MKRTKEHPSRDLPASMPDSKRFSTVLVYPRPSFFRGMGSVLDLFGLFSDYRIARDGNAADARALYSDFRAVGIDLTKAMSKYESAQKNRSKQATSRA